jgi:hypothetical protein
MLEDEEERRRREGQQGPMPGFVNLNDMYKLSLRRAAAKMRTTARVHLKPKRRKTKPRQKVLQDTKVCRTAGHKQHHKFTGYQTGRKLTICGPVHSFDL